MFSGRNWCSLRRRLIFRHGTFVKKEEYQCIDVDEDDFVTLLTADGDTRSDIKLPRSLPPPEVPGAEELSTKICDLLKEEKDFYVIVQIACGTEQIMDIKVMTEAK